MSPAPTARARPSPSCARCSKPPASACTSTPRRIWCASTSASGSARRAAGAGRTMRAGRRARRMRARQRRRADHRVRDRDRGRLPAVRAAPGRRAAARGRPRRPARRDQRDRAARSPRVITPISLDHEEFLGDTLEKIAAEKAGILKRGVPAMVATAAARGARACIERQAARLRAPLKVAGERLDGDRGARPLVYQDENGLLDLPPPRLFGRHQFDNAGIAIAALRARRRRSCRAAAYRGRPGQGRLAGAAAAPATAGSSRSRPPAASCGSTAATIPTAGARSRRRWPISRSACRGRWCLIVGMLATKDSEGFLRNFAGLARRVIAVPIPSQEKGLPRRSGRRRGARRRHAGASRADHRGSARARSASSNSIRRRGS